LTSTAALLGTRTGVTPRSGIALPEGRNFQPPRFPPGEQIAVTVVVGTTTADGNGQVGIRLPEWLAAGVLLVGLRGGLSRRYAREWAVRISDIGGQAG